MASPQNPPYAKRFLDVPDQVAQLQQRGLGITDQKTAESCLRRIGYYRLSAYWYPFRVLTNARPPVRSDQFLPGSRLEDAVALYVFDKKLKMLVMDALERVEVAVRVELSLCLGRKGAFAYLDPTQLHPDFSTRFTHSGPPSYITWVNKMSQPFSRSKEDFVQHFKSKYELPMPIWIACELWDFGMMSTLYSGLKAPDKQAIAVNFKIANGALLESWLRALNSVRNIVAHHARLWNRVLVDYPTLPRRGVIPSFDVLLALPNVEKRIYAILCVLAHLLNEINPNSNWKHRVVALANSFPTMPHAKLNDMGFPSLWQTHSFWI